MECHGGVHLPQHQRRARTASDLIIEYLGGLGFPCSKSDIVRLAANQHAPQEIVAALERLPEEPYSSRDDIMRHFRRML